MKNLFYSIVIRMPLSYLAKMEYALQPWEMDLQDLVHIFRHTPHRKRCSLYFLLPGASMEFSA